MQIGKKMTSLGRPSPTDGVQRNPHIRGRYDRSAPPGGFFLLETPNNASHQLRAQWMSADITNGLTFPMYE